MDEWRWMSAAALGDGIGAGRIDPVALTETFLDAIEAHPDGDRIYARVTGDRARAEARAAADRAASGLRRGPLDGVPVSWKDVFDTAGIATEAGTALMKDRVPEADAQVLRNATAAGLVCLGKTHMSEIAFSGLGLNPITATPPNRHDPAAVPGGSSPGTAASVAFGLAAAGIGSDTGGSVRIPAAWNDLVGFKTTHGALPLAGTVPLCLTFDTIGPLCRDTSDAALLIAALGGTPASDPGDRSVSGMRFAILETVVLDDIRAAPLAAFETACARLERAGATCVRLKVPDLAETFGFAGALYTADSYAWWKDKVEAAPERMFPQILERVRGGREVAAHDYIAHWSRLRAIRATYAEATASVDAVVMPTAPTLPPDRDRLLRDDTYYKTENLLALRNTRVANLMGTCSVTLPTGETSCGIMLNGAVGDDARLMTVARAVERALA